MTIDLRPIMSDEFTLVQIEMREGDEDYAEAMRLLALAAQRATDRVTIRAAERLRAQGVPDADMPDVEIKIVLAVQPKLEVAERG